MKTENKIISAKKQQKLIKSLPKYLKRNKKALRERYGLSKTQKINLEAKRVFPEIVSLLPTFNSTMYDSLMELASKMAALKKGMKSVGIGTPEFVKFNIEQTRYKAAKAPAIIRRVAGKLYLSKLMRKYLNSVAKTVTKNGWPTNLINGSKEEDFVMSLETRNCQMVAFWESIDEGDIRPYCTFFDFSAAEALGIGLKQVSNIDSGVCKYCFYKNGNVEWPEKVKEVIETAHHKN